MRILHVVRGLGNSSGTTHAVVPLAEAQAALGHVVSVAGVEKRGQPTVLPDPGSVGLMLYPLSLPFDNPGVSLGFARAISSHVADVDVVHIHAIWNFPTWWTMRDCARSGVPFIVAPQGSFDPWALGINRWGKRLYGAWAEKPLLRRAARLQALTAKEREQFRAELGDVPTDIIPNGVDPRPFEAPVHRAHAGSTVGRRTLLSLSRLHPKKGVDRLLRGFATAARLDPTVDLVVAGSDAGSGYGETLRSLAGALGIGERTRFTGEVRSDEKVRTLRAADAFVLASHSEGLPVAVLEAMAAALPVVISRECNLPEIETCGVGWVVEGDPESVSQALGSLFADWDAAKARGAKGRALVGERFAWPRIAQRTIEMYDRCLLESGPRR